jgi:hypothetical protein
VGEQGVVFAPQDTRLPATLVEAVPLGQELKGNREGFEVAGRKAQALREETFSLCCIATQQSVWHQYDVLNTFVDKFIKLRKAAGDIDRYIHRALLDMFQTGMPNAYQKSIEYINLRVSGEERDAAEKRIKSSAMYYASDLSFDEKRFEELTKQENLIALVESMWIAQKECLEIREKILGLKGFQFNS